MRRLLILAVPMIVCWTALFGQPSANLFRQFFGYNAITESEFVEMGLQALISSGSLNTSQDEARTLLREHYKEEMKKATEAKIEELKQFKLLIDEINKQKKKSLFGNLAKVGLAMLGGVADGVEVARADKQAKEQQQELERQQYRQQLEQQWAAQQSATQQSYNNSSDGNSYLKQQEIEVQKKAIRQQVEKEYPKTSANASTYNQDVEMEVQRRLSGNSGQSMAASAQRSANSRRVNGTLYYSVNGTEYSESIMVEVVDEGNRMYVKSYRMPKRIADTLDPDGLTVPVSNYAQPTSFNIDGFKANDHQWKIQISLERTALSTSFGYIYF